MKEIISTESWDSLQPQSLAIARQVDAGKTLPKADYHLSFADSAQLFRVLAVPHFRNFRKSLYQGPGFEVTICSGTGIAMHSCAPVT